MIEYHSLKKLLKGLRGKNRRALELAIAQANSDYNALEQEASAQIAAIRPTIDAAYEVYQTTLLNAAKTFLASIPEEAIRSRYAYNNFKPYPNHATVADIVGSMHAYYYIDLTKRQALRDRLDALREFLLTNQPAASPSKTNTKLDAEAAKLLETFDASRQLVAGPSSTADVSTEATATKSEPCPICNPPNTCTGHFEENH
jgi:hypothetical protein